MLTFERNRKLTMSDIADLRAYEREREDFRLHVRARKDRRRIAVGDIITFTFECADTIRFQIQEMARAEKMLTDERIQGEIDAYNPLIPEAGQLSATMFIELTTKIDLMHWLPLLVGVERSVRLVLPGGDIVEAIVEEGHESQLTRDDITSSVHYLRFELDADQTARFAAGPVTLAVEHPNYSMSTTLSEESVTELAGDLAG